MEWIKKFRFSRKSFNKKNYIWSGFKNLEKKDGIYKNKKKSYMLLQLIMELKKIF